MSSFGRKHGQEGSAGEGAAAGPAPAVGKHALVGATAGNTGAESSPGKHTLVETAMAKMGSGTPVPADVRAGVEAGTGGDLSSATVHAGPAASQIARDVDARVFTFGSQIVLGDSASMSDAQLLAHEATHVVQQAGRSPQRHARYRRPEADQRGDQGVIPSGTCRFSKASRSLE
ncbi:MAG TPA: DUF4157 domain-containing protein [Kofleriaceae bacterium]